MKLEIDIDEKYFGIDIADHFQDFFKRLQTEIKSRLISNDTLVCGNYELETIEMFLTAFKNATIEQETATWCTDCKEYDQDEHCCHRFSKVIRDTVEEMKQESVLDKIRAFIDKPVIRDEYSQRQNDYCDGYEFVCDQIMEIIDKYRAKKEEEK